LIKGNWTDNDKEGYPKDLRFLDISENQIEILDMNKDNINEMVITDRMSNGNIMDLPPCKDMVIR